MAEVALHQYCEEVKELIRSESYDEAVAICRHILEHFSKYITPYRLLGEACLEKEDYVEAASLFKRVLSADPEDVIAYVGLGIIYDQEGALEESIWQLERAFELTPGNSEIRGELQRLYGERDGTAPPRLRLTPAALGRLYLKEELYQRAIDEFRNVLEEDAERADTQVALAEALWWADQRREAAAVCEDLLRKLPNCLKANLILGEILLNSDREEEGRTLLQTAQAIDPENIVAQKLFRDQSPLPSEAVHVRRLEKAELEAEAKEVRHEEETLSSSADAELEEAMPDWLRKLREGERQPTDEEHVVPAQAEEMPDWLRELGQGTPGEPEEAIAAGEKGLPALEEEAPTWLRELEGASEAPRAEEVSLPPTRDEEELPTVEEEAEISEETIAGLGETMPDESASIEEVMAGMEKPRGIMVEEKQPEEAAPSDEEAPDWLREIRAEVVEEEMTPPAEAREEIPSWLRESEEETAQEEVAVTPEEMEKESPVIAALDEESPLVEEEEVEISEETIARLRETMPDESASIEEIMAWMERSRTIIAEEEGSPGVLEIADEQGETPPRQVAEIPPLPEEAPSWLRELRAEALEEQAAGPPEEVEAPVEQVRVPAEEEIPPWLRELRVEAVEEEATPSEEVEPSVEEETPSWLRELRVEAVEEEATPSEEVEPSVEEETPSWLRELRAEAMEEEPTALPEEVEAPFEEVTIPPEEEGIPSWLRELRAEAVEEEVAAPAEEAEAPFEEVTIPSEEEGIPSWLRELRAEAVEEEPIALPEEVEAPFEEVTVPPEEEGVPSWLRELRAEAVEEEVAMPSEEEIAPPSVEEGIPPSFVEEPSLPSLIEIVPVEEEVPEVAPAAEKIEEEVIVEGAEVSWGTEDYLNHLASKPQDHRARLALARAYLQQRALDEAAFHYGEIVSSGSLLDEVIDDLEAMADDAPDHLRTHELLADAYMKDGRLQKALDKYRWLRVKLAD